MPLLTELEEGVMEAQGYKHVAPDGAGAMNVESRCGVSYTFAL
jgi:hypothetical protein